MFVNHYLLFSSANLRIILHLRNHFYIFAVIFGDTRCLCEKNTDLTNMKPIVYKTLTWFVFPVVIILISWAIVHGIMEPVKFNKEKAQREEVGIQRLKDIRTIQSAFKSETGHYASTIDSLKNFYNDGSLVVKMQFGSQDDSIAVANTEAFKKELKKRNPRISKEEMELALYQEAKAGGRIISVSNQKVAVKDTLFNSRPNFCIDSIFVIPFCGEPVKMETVVKQVSGVPVPLFEASMLYKQLLKGMDNQLRINLDAERIDTGRFPGLMVGSITAPNNNAGNWE